MKYFIIYPDQKPQELDLFKKNNQHLSTEIIPIKAPISNQNLRNELLEEKLITQNNIYDLTTLAFAKTHISLWKQAVETQTSITVFEANVVTNKDFLEHQEHSLSEKKDYDLIIWGYDLNWNPCLQISPCLPKAIYSFSADNEDDFGKKNNDLINVSAYQKSDLTVVQTIKAFSFASMGCYTISPKGAKQLLQKITPIDKESAPSYQDKPHGTNFYVFPPLINRENISFDIEVNRHIEYLNTYITIPMLAVLPTEPFCKE